MREWETPVSLLPMQSFLRLLAFTVTPVIFWSYHGHILTLRPLQTGLNLDVLMSCNGHISKQWAHGSSSAGIVTKLKEHGGLAKLVFPCEDVWTLSESRWGESFCMKYPWPSSYDCARDEDDEELVGWAEKAAWSRGKLFLRGSTHLQWTTPPPPCTRFAVQCHNVWTTTLNVRQCNEIHCNVLCRGSTHLQWTTSLYTFCNEPLPCCTMYIKCTCSAI